MNVKTYEKFLKNHIKKILVNSNYQYQYMMGKAEDLFEDDPLWCYITRGLDIQHGLIFSGPEGSGKHSAAALAVKKIAEETENFAYIYISGNDFNFSEEIMEADLEYRSGLKEEVYSLNIAELFLNEMLSIIYYNIGDGKDKRVIVFIDDDEQSTLLYKLYQSVAFDIIKSDHTPDLPMIFVVVVTKDESNVSHILRQQLGLIKMDMPDENDRNIVIQNSLLDDELKELVLCESAEMSFPELNAVLEMAVAGGYEEKSQNQKLIKRLVTSVKTKHIPQNTCAPVVISSGGGNESQTALLDEIKKMNQNISENTPKQLTLNKISDTFV